MLVWIHLPFKTHSMYLLLLLLLLHGVAGRLPVRGLHAPLLLSGRLQLDAAGGGAAVPHGGPGLQHHHPPALPLPRRLRGAAAHRGGVSRRQAGRLRHREAVSPALRLQLLAGTDSLTH